MNIRKIIRETITDLEWMSGDGPFQVTTTNGEKYWLSHDKIKAGDFVVYQTASGLWREYGKINPEKVDDANNFTDYYKVIDPLMMEEEMDDFDWVKDIPTGIELKPNTMYYFEPIGSPKVLHNLANAITNAPYIKGLLGKRTEPLKYFVTGDDVNDLWGWCKGINPFEAKEEFYYNQVDMVDVRKTFGDIL